MNIISVKDYLGRELKTDDQVVYVYGTHNAAFLARGKVVGVKMENDRPEVVLEIAHQGSLHNIDVDPSKIMKI